MSSLKLSSPENRVSCKWTESDGTPGFHLVVLLLSYSCLISKVIAHCNIPKKFVVKNQIFREYALSSCVLVVPGLPSCCIFIVIYASFQKWKTLKLFWVQNSDFPRTFAGSAWLTLLYFYCYIHTLFQQWYHTAAALKLWRKFAKLLVAWEFRFINMKS